MKYILLFLFLLGVFCNATAQDYYDERQDSKYGYTPVRKGEFWGVLDSTNRLVAKCQYKNAQVVSFGCDIRGLLLDGNYCFIGKDSLRCYHQLYGYENGYAKASKNGLLGYVDKEGREVVPCEYKNISNLNNSYFKIVKNDNKVGVMSRYPPRVVIPAIYEPVKHLNDNYYKIPNAFYFRKDGNVGVIDSSGKIIIPFKHKELFFLGKSKLVVLEDSTKELLKLGVCDLQYHFLLPMGSYVIKNMNYYFDAKEFVTAQKNGKYGVLNRNLEAIIPFEYDNISWCSKYRMIVELNKKKGMVDTMFRHILLPEYDHIYPVNDTIIIVTQNKLSGFLNEKGEIILPIAYESMSTIEKIGYIVRKNGKYGILDFDLKEVLPIVYDEITHKYYAFWIRQNKKWGFFKEKDIIWLPKGEMYTNIEPLGYTVVAQKKEKNGRIISALIDITGKEIIPFSKKMEKIQFSNDGSVVIIGKTNKNGQMLYGWVKIKENILVNPQYEDVKVSGDLFYVSKNNKNGLVDKHNKVLVSPIYSEIHSIRKKFYSEDFAYLVYNGSKIGILDTDYKLITPEFYDNIEVAYNCDALFANGRLVVIKNGKKGVLDEKGNELIPPILTYDYVLPRADGYYDVNNGGQYFCQCVSCSIGNGAWGLLSPEGKLLTSISSFAPIIKFGNVFERTKAVFFAQEDSIFSHKRQKARRLPDRITIEIIDSSGSVIGEYDKAYPINHGIVMVQIGQKIGAIDKNGKEIMSMIYDDMKYEFELNAYPFHIVAKDGKWGLLDTTLKWLVEPQYSDIVQGNQMTNDTSVHLLRYCVGRMVDVCEKRETVHGKWGIMTTNGKILSPPIYKSIEGFYKGYSKIAVDGNPDGEYQGDLYGLVDSTGRVIVEPIYKDIWNNIPYFVRVITPDGKQGLISLQGKILAPCRFDMIAFTEEKYTTLFIKDSIYVIDRKGKQVFAISYEKNKRKDFNVFDKTLFIRENENTTMYYMNTNRKKVFALPLEYRIRRFDKKIGIMTVGDVYKTGLINTKGKIIIPIQNYAITIDKKHRKIIQQVGNKKIIYNLKGKKLREVMD